MEQAAYELLRILAIREFYRLDTELNLATLRYAEQKEPDKQIADFIEALEKGKKSLDDVHLRIYGTRIEPT